MNDLISREAATGAVEDIYNKILSQQEKHYNEKLSQLDSRCDEGIEDVLRDDFAAVDKIIEFDKRVRTSLEGLPSVDAVEVVRCKDCKWGEAYTVANGNEFYYCAEAGVSARIETDFCSHGERKDE